MVLAMAIDAVVVLAAAALTLLLPRRAASRRPAVTEEPAAELSAGVAQQAKSRSFASFWSLQQPKLTKDLWQAGIRRGVITTLRAEFSAGGQAIGGRGAGTTGRFGRNKTAESGTGVRPGTGADLLARLGRCG